MKKFMTVAFTMLLAGSLAFAQAGGASGDNKTNPPASKAPAATSGKKATKSSKAHKGGKKSKKGASTTTGTGTTNPK